MNFNKTQAAKVANHYCFLIGKKMDFSEGHFITHIVITPFYGGNLKLFWDVWGNTENNERALLSSGYDPNAMLVFLVSYDGFSNVLAYDEIEKYLDRHHMEKAFLSPDF